MGTYQADIQQKQKEIDSHRNDVYALFSDLGFSVALLEQLSPLGFAQEEYQAFVEVDTRYEEAKQTYERIKRFMSQLDDRSRKIEQIEADIRALKGPRKKLYARLGAIAYEAYGSSTLPDYLEEVCTPLFAGHHKKAHTIQNALEHAKKQKGVFKAVERSFLSVRVRATRRQIMPLLLQAGTKLATLGCETDLPGIGKESLVEELSQFRKREQALEQELDIHHSAVAKLRSEEIESPKSQLESSRAVWKELEKQRVKVSHLYGKALYENLRKNTSSSSIGATSLGIMEQISLHQRRMVQLEQDILALQNLMKVEELEAQIELENQKIRHLRDQIEQSKKQIFTVELSIARKRDKIASLSPKQT